MLPRQPVVIALPPELMSPEEREHRAAVIQGAIAREWLRFAITEALVLWLPFAVFLLVYLTTDAIPESMLVPAVIVGGTLCGALVAYWVYVRIRPLQDELRHLERSDGVDA